MVLYSDHNEECIGFTICDFYLAQKYFSNEIIHYSIQN